ncbi:MAG: CRISPR-associated endonuclease Cas1 [Chloroflexi bacterium]|nr:CRISPR-associated endonuclease Cas1 [Chloroflexota bacterium]
MTDLIVEQPGAFVGLRSRRLRVTTESEPPCEHAILNLERVLIVGRGVGISSDAIRACAADDVPIIFLDDRGALYARVVGQELMGTARTRRAQIAAAASLRGAAYARALVVGALHNRAAFLKYATKNHRDERYARARDAIADLEECATAAAQVDAADAPSIATPLMALEARGARAYWPVFGTLLRGVEWPGRVAPDAEDLPNALLNYGYGVLEAEIERAIALAGLDPYAGFLHADRPGRVSLVYDAMEEFRQTAVDRVVLGLLNRDRPLNAIEGRLDPSSRRTLAQAIRERLETPVRVGRDRRRLRVVIQEQVREAAAFFRGERGAYRPYPDQW